MSYQLSLPYLDENDAKERAADRLKQVRADMGMVPNLYRAMANAPGVLDTYLHGYELFRKESGFSPAEQEVIFLSISLENGCHYCMAAHSFLADNQSKVPEAVTEALRDDKTIPDEKLRVLSQFTRTMVEKRGWPSEADVRVFLEAGYSETHILEIVLAIAVKTLSNYTNHLFDTPLDELFQARRWRQASQD